MNVLLAESRPERLHPVLESIRSAFNRGPQTGETLMLLVIALLLALLFIIALRRGRTGTRPPLDYLKLACRRLGLSHAERRDLLTLAQRGQLAQPAAMLCSPANLAWAMHQAGVSPGEVQLRQRLGRLCQRLFDEPLPGA